MADLTVAIRPNGTGEITSIKDTPRPWGQRVRLPHRIRLRITDRTKAQVEHFLNDWPLRFKHEVLNDTANGWRIELTVDPDFIDASGIARSKMKQEMKEYINDDDVGLWAGASVHSFTPESMLVDIPKINLQTQTVNDLAILKIDFRDKFDGLIENKRYHFSAQAVSNAVAQGDKIIEMTGEQVLFFIIDKLDL